MFKVHYALKDTRFVEELRDVLTHYLFIDEAYQVRDNHRQIVMTGWIVEKTLFNSRFDSNGSLYMTPVLISIEFALEEIAGMAFVASANLPAEVSRAGERDSTDDITGMSRTDNIWSQCFIFTVANLIKMMIGAGSDIGYIDIFHDPKSLTADHSSAIFSTLRGTVVALAKKFTVERNMGLLNNLEVRHISSVTKAHDRAPNSLQRAIWIADKLCSFALSGDLPKANPRIGSVDITDLILRSVRQFDGIPFDEPGRLR